MDLTTKSEYIEYCDKVDILVKHLREYLLEELKTSTVQYKCLLREKEGWVEYQVLEWLGKKVQETYGWSAWDVCMIDVMAILTCEIVRYIKLGEDPKLEDFSFQTIGESSTS
jgi:hypothetical protein